MPQPVHCDRPRHVGGFSSWEPDIGAEPPTGDVPVGFHCADAARLILTGRTPLGSVPGVRATAVLFAGMVNMRSSRPIPLASMNARSLAVIWPLSLSRRCSLSLG